MKSSQSWGWRRMWTPRLLQKENISFVSCQTPYLNHIPELLKVETWAVPELETEPKVLDDKTGLEELDMVSVRDADMDVAVVLLADSTWLRVVESGSELERIELGVVVSAA
jgi:hypothetical protein